MRVQFTLVLLAQILCGGAMLEPQTLGTWGGGVLLAAYTTSLIFVWRNRSSRELIAASLPWIVFGLYGLANAILICAGRMQRSFEPALAERYGSFTLFFVLGATFLTAVVLRHGHGHGHTRRLWIRRAVVPTFTLLIAAHVMNWARGAQVMEDWSKRMAQERARLAFMNLFPLDSQWMQSRQTRPSTFRLANFLAEHHRLRGVRLATDDRIKAFHRGSDVSLDFAQFDEPAQKFEGEVELSGIGGESRTSPAELILISASVPHEEERIVAVTAPLVPDRSHQLKSYTRKHPEQFMGWSRSVSRLSLPQQSHFLQAYVFDYEKWAVRKMDGIHEVQGLP
jgi:hypothetical protein